jgi:hypothetical protein
MAENNGDSSFALVWRQVVPWERSTLLPSGFVSNGLGLHFSQPPLQKSALAIVGNQR